MSKVDFDQLEAMHSACSSIRELLEDVSPFTIKYSEVKEFIEDVDSNTNSIKEALDIMSRQNEGLKQQGLID